MPDRDQFSSATGILFTALPIATLEKNRLNIGTRA
jgi:hypothetical protein